MMRPTPREQLVGIRSILAEVVSPLVRDPYAADVLAGALATLDLLAAAEPEVVPFLRWDITESLAVLALVGVEAPPAPADPLDLEALAAHHDAVRASLESSVPLIRAHPGADRVFVALMIERADRYPFAARPQGTASAHAAR